MTVTPPIRATVAFTVAAGAATSKMATSIRCVIFASSATSRSWPALAPAHRSDHLMAAAEQLDLRGEVDPRRRPAPTPSTPCPPWCLPDRMRGRDRLAVHPYGQEVLSIRPP